MDKGSALVGAILLIMCLAPFLIIRFYNLRKKNKMMQTLRRIANENRCKIGHHEFCGNIVIGFDENNKYVFFHNYKIEQAVSEYVELAEIKACQLVKKTRNTSNKSYNIDIIERLELSFITSNKVKEPIQWIVFEEDVNNQIVNELVFAEKWVKEINKCLKSMR